MLRSGCDALLVSFVWLVGCGGSAQSFPVRGAEDDVALMAGRWQGTYAGTESGRHGTVVFDLTMGHHVAEGNVFMRAEGQAEPAQPLQIEFVHSEHGIVEGKIRPYNDPRCSCAVDTQFKGTMVNDAITGSFTTALSSSGQVEHGTWEVRRQAR